MTLDNRQSPRLRCNALVAYRTGEQGSVGIVTDVSAHGLRLLCQPPLDLDTTVDLAPLSGAYSGLPSCRGTVVWQIEEPMTGRREAGIQFFGERGWIGQLLNASGHDMGLEPTRPRLQTPRQSRLQIT
ncbi:MAG: PilZ domain-containing protein [Vulcanimicrobiota bacterium]